MLHFDFCHVFSLPVTYMKFPVCGGHPRSFPPVGGLKSPEWCEGPRREVKQEAAQMAPILGQLGHGVGQVNPTLWLFLDHGVLQTLMSAMQKRLSKEKIQSHGLLVMRSHQNQWEKNLKTYPTLRLWFAGIIV